MNTILILTAICLPLAWFSEQNTNYQRSLRGEAFLREDPSFWLLTLTLVLFTGLRTAYNDTWNYAQGFQTSEGLTAFFAYPENLNPLGNPLFYLYQAFLRHYTDNAQVLIFTSSAFVQVCFLLFFKRYSRHFTFTVFLYFTLGTFNVSMAAIKQMIAMAIITLALPALEKERWVRYYLLVLLAALFHTYAAVFVVLPLFRRVPWSGFTFLFVGLTAFVLFNFRTVIGEFLDYINDLGKNVAEYEVFDEHTVNLLRVAVYAVPPLLSLFYARRANYDAKPIDHVFVHMSILSLAAMSMGTQAGANMFARMAHYFELGTLVCLPQLLDKTFEKTSYRLVAAIAVICFTGFFLYANQGFDGEYAGLGILNLF